MMIRIFLVTVLLVVFSFSTHAGIYQCVGSDGKTVFKDSECDDDESLEKSYDPQELLDRTTIIGGGVRKAYGLNENLIVNASFENELADWRVPVGAEWVSVGGIYGTGALVIQAERPPEDKYIHETVVDQCLSIEEDKTYEFTAQFFTATAPIKSSANRANVIWYESSDCTTGGQWGAYLEPKKNIPGWQRLVRKKLSPSLGAKAVLITIVQKGRYSNNGRAHWDNLKFGAIQTHSVSSTTIKNTNSQRSFFTRFGSYNNE